MKFLQLSIFDALFGPPRRRAGTPRRRSTTRRSVRGDDRELKSLWNQIAGIYFPERADLLNYTVHWSTRPQKRTLASCNIKQHRVVVARELNTPDCKKWLDPLLYHEMCHAALGLSIQSSSGKRLWHGAQFRELERKHPRIAELDHWVKSGGWRFAVRSERSRRAHAERRASGSR